MNVNYVFIGCCNPEDLTDFPLVNYYGNILTIYEKSDVLGQSCLNMRKRSGNNVSRFKEMRINTGLKHGFLFKALDVWIKPSINWANQKLK